MHIHLQCATVYIVTNGSYRRYTFFFEVCTAPYTVYIPYIRCYTDLAHLLLFLLLLKNVVGGGLYNQSVHLQHCLANEETVLNRQFGLRIAFMGQGISQNTL